MSSCVSFRCFFFSSRRRHTRSTRDWSSDVCSSDLEPCGGGSAAFHALQLLPHPSIAADHRSEERRVGKECRSRWWTYREKKKNREGGPIHGRSREKATRCTETGTTQRRLIT